MVCYIEDIKAYRTKVDKVTYSDHYPLRSHLQLNIQAP